MHRNARNALRKLFMLALVCLLPLWQLQQALAETVNSVTVNAAPLATASAALDGMVRVYLSSLGSPATLGITVAGSYSLSTGTALTNGETLTVGFSSSTGAITLTRGGVKTNMGTFFALKRHSATGSNGLLIAQARKPANPYPGDLSFEAVRQSSGSYKLYTVAHIYLENYLYGVLPYEMGSSAHTEALKAQAVAARTYTVRMMANRASGLYDVVDTTSDQVYNGTPSGYATCVAAVDATKGIVLKNNGSYTATYYSASNGGQTEAIANIWGTSGYSYLGVKDDPFDYANPDSTVKRATVYTDLTSTSTSSTLKALLLQKAVSALSASGYAATSANTTLATLKSVVVHTPMYASPSKLYTKMDFTLTATTRNSAGGAVTATTTVTCDIFSELESLLGLSIQSGKNELWSVTKNSTSYTLEARRYGHGLGMSQRGAMYMGKLGYTYDSILGFYYPGCTRVGCTFTNTILAADSTETVTTEENAASVDTTSTSGSGTAIVKLVSSVSSLAIRATKSTSAAVLGVVADSSPVTLYANDGTWCLIGFGGLRGYVPTNALTITGAAQSTDDGNVTATQGFAIVKASGYLNLRASGSYSATVLTTAPTGAVLTVFDKGSGWAHVQYGATVAYASTDFLTFTDTYPNTVVSSGSGTATVTAADGETVPMRASASTSGTVLTQLAAGVTVRVLRDDGSWASVEMSGLTGYVLSASLTYADEATSTTGGNTSTEPTTTTGEWSATVSATLTQLRSAADANAAVLLEIALGQSVVVTQKGDTWCAARYEGATGYLLTADLTFPQQSTTGVAATVTTQSGSLNMRQEARAGSTILIAIPQNATVSVTSRGTTWSAVTYGGLSGYVMTAYLTFATDTTSTVTATPESGTAIVTTASGSLNLRQEGKAGSTILRTIPQYATVQVNLRGVDWSSVTYAGSTGYVMSVFLTFGSDVVATATPSPTPTPASATDATATVTATPTPTPTPTADTGVLTAIVTTASGSLNLRADVLPGSRVLTRIPRGTMLTIQTRLAAWSQTTYEGYTGYVMNAYLTFPAAVSETTGDTATGTATTATVLTSSGSLNLRSQPYGSVLTTIPQAATVQVQQRGSDWCYVLYNGTYGYAMTAYLSFTEPVTATVTPVATVTPATTDASATPTPTPTPTATGTTVLTATVLTPSGSLNLRVLPSTSAQILTTIPRLATVTVTDRGSEWCAVQYGGLTGYVVGTYLEFSAQTATATATVTITPTPTPTPVAGASATVAWVYTASGSLNLRSDASTTASVLTTIPRLAQVTLLAQGSTWCQVEYNAFIGYVMTTYLVTTQPAELTSQTTAPTATPATADSAVATATPTPGPVEDPTMKTPATELYAYVTPPDDGNTLPLYPACTQANSLLDMIRNSMVQVLRQGDTWCEVLYFDQKGFCLTGGLTVIVP
ncbi:MAG: SH3 domain-containing protein [Candidatus Limiplasma sp.]|nr:SH3 domain-containing protein [Candidatus Limiplasma sp.]